MSLLDRVSNSHLDLASPCLQLPDPNHALDTVLFALLYLVWPMVFAVGMFLFVLKISFAPPDDQDVER